MGVKVTVKLAVMVAVKVEVAVAVAVAVEVGVLVMVSGVNLKVDNGGKSVRLASDGVAVGVLGPGLIIMATHPRQ